MKKILKRLKNIKIIKSFLFKKEMKQLNCTQIKKKLNLNRGNICTYKKTKWETQNAEIK